MRKDGEGQWKEKSEKLNEAMASRYKAMNAAAIAKGDVPVEHGRVAAQCLHRCAHVLHPSCMLYVAARELALQAEYGAHNTTTAAGSHLSKFGATLAAAAVPPKTKIDAGKILKVEEGSAARAEQGALDG